MKTFLLAFLFLPLLFITTHAQTLPSADAVISKYLNAIGGKKALMQIKDVSILSTISNSSGSNPITSKYKAPAKRVIEITDSTGKATYKQVIDGKQVFTQFQGKTVPTNPADLQRTILEAQWIPELTLAEKGVKYTLTGTETVNGQEAYKIVYTLADGAPLWTTYYDAQTGLKVKSVFPGQNGPETIAYSDYRDVKGIKVPYHLSGYGSEAQTSKYQMNTGISDAEFVIK